MGTKAHHPWRAKKTKSYLSCKLYTHTMEILSSSLPMQALEGKSMVFGQSDDLIPLLDMQNQNHYNGGDVSFLPPSLEQKQEEIAKEKHDNPIAFASKHEDMAKEKHDNHLAFGTKHEELVKEKYEEIAKEKQDNHLMGFGTNHKEIASSPTKKLKIMVVGATGYIGRFLALAATSAGHSTYAIVRPSTASNPAKATNLKELKDSGIQLVVGCLDDTEFLVRVLQGIDVVISAVSEIEKQHFLIDAIKQVDSVKRFLPSEFGHDIDKTEPMEAGLMFYNMKRDIRRTLEKSNIPFTYICCNSIASWPYSDNTHPSEVPPPVDKFEIYGNGDIKAYFVSGEDIGKFTIKVVEDERTLNKSVHFRPSKNFVTMNELAAMWESKICKKLPRVWISEDDLLSLSRVSEFPANIVASLTQDIFINGCQYKYEIDGQNDLEVFELYPCEPYTTISEFFDTFVPLITKS